MRILLICLFLVSIASAQEPAASLEPISAPVSVSEPRSLFWIPMTNVLWPGLSQAIDQEYGKSLAFGSYALTGYVMAQEARERQKKFLDDDDGLRFHHFRDLRNFEHWGQSIQNHSLFLSAYESFRTRVGDHQAQGKYQFLPREQSLNQILMAPFDFGYMKRATTWVPFVLAIGVGGNWLKRNPVPGQWKVRGSDIALGSAISYNAGTGEEAFFRGFLYPLLYEKWNGSWTANAAQSMVFGLGHPDPYMPALAGLYFGWLTERNHFDLGEATFIHAWWDFWVINADLIRRRSFTEDYYFRLPPLQVSF